MYVLFIILCDMWIWIWISKQYYYKVIEISVKLGR